MRPIVLVSMKAMVSISINMKMNIQNYISVKMNSAFKTRLTGGLANEGRPGTNQITWLEIFLANMTYSEK